jgi:hypothetical protein
MQRAPELTFLVEERRGAIDVFKTWVIRIPVVLVFLLIGVTKFNNDPHGEWFKIFERIGFGQWFRYATGAIQVTGAVLLLTRWTRTLGAAMLSIPATKGVEIGGGFAMAARHGPAPMVLLCAVVATWFAGRE